MADQSESRTHSSQRTDPVDWAEPEFNLARAEREHAERKARDPKFKAESEAARNRNSSKAAAAARKRKAKERKKKDQK